MYLLVLRISIAASMAAMLMRWWHGKMPVASENCRLAIHYLWQNHETRLHGVYVRVGL